MDFKKLIEDGIYRREDLNKENEMFIRGIEYAAKQLDCVFDDSEFETFSPTIDKIHSEIANGVVETLKEWLSVTVAEMTVTMIDEQEASGNAGKEVDTSTEDISERQEIEH